MSAGPCILIADDDPHIRRTLNDILHANGYQTVQAVSGLAVEEALRQSSPAVALVDLRLSDMSGLDVMKLIKKTSPRTECIVLTGYASQETAIQAINLGAYSYLQKPFDIDQLLVSIMRAVEKGERLEAMVEKNRELEAALDELKRTQDRVVQQERLNALGQMVSGIVHDFNNVLMPIVGLSELLVVEDSEPIDQEEVADIVDNIRSAAADAREIVRRLREFYKPNEDLEVAPVPLRDLVTSAVDLTEPAWKSQREAGGHPIHIVRETADDPKVLANEARLREVLTNLILNAVDAMPDGGTLRIRTARQDRWGQVHIADSGGGMTEEVLRRCIEPFYSTKGKDGTGLGLSVCHGIVARHGGRLQIESRPGSGTTVTVSLPVVPPGEEWQVPPGMDETESADALPPLRVLVIDDAVGPRKILARILVRDGHSVAVATSGPEGLDLLKNGEFDLVVTDRAMPGMNGDQVAAEVKKLRPHLPVILLTGFGDVMMYSGESPSHVDEVVSKPVTPEEFRVCVKRVMRNVAHARRSSNT